MTIGLDTVFSVASLGLATASFLFARKKDNKTDGFELGQFTGRMETEIKSIKNLIEELKNDNKEVDEKITKGIREHEIHYDDKISRMIADHENKYHTK